MELALCSRIMWTVFNLYFTKLIHKPFQSYWNNLSYVSSVFITMYYRNKHTYLPFIYIHFLLASWHPRNMCNFFFVKVV